MLKRFLVSFIMNAVWFLSLIFAVAVKAGPPVFEETFTNVTFPTNVTAETFCNASGDTPIKYTWYDEYSFEIKPNSGLPVYSRSSDPGSYLVFDNTIPSQKGSYTCKAQNTHGIASKIIEVFIRPNVDPDIKYVNILDITETSVRFHVHTTWSSDDITISFKEDRDVSWKKRNFTTNGDTELYIEMNDLVPSGKYDFEFNARSSEGQYTPEIVISHVVLLPSAPEVIFQSLNEGSLKIQWFRSIDDIMRGTLLDHTLSYRTVSMMSGGNTWDYKNKCFTNITIPSCGPSFYTFSDLYPKNYYEFQVKARTIAGYGPPSKFKIYIQ